MYSIAEERNIAIFGYQYSTSLITLNVEFWKDVTYVRITNLFRSTPVQVSSFYRLVLYILLSIATQLQYFWKNDFQS